MTPVKQLPFGPGAKTVEGRSPAYRGRSLALRSIPHESRRWKAAPRAALSLLSILVLLACPGVLQAQLSDSDVISTQGTQFVRPEPPKPPRAPKSPKPPRRVQPTPPRQPAAVRQAPAPPSRFPSVVILLDTSDSMLNKVPGRETTRLDEAKEALIRVVRGMSRETRVQVWTFNTRRYPLSVKGVPPGQFAPVGQPGLKERLIRRIAAVRTAGGTNLYKAVIRTLEIFANPADQTHYRSGQRFPVLVVISDGEDGGKTGHTVDAVLAARRRYPLVTINTIGFHIKGENKWFRQLCRISTRPSGCATADNQDRLQQILESFYRPRT